MHIGFEGTNQYRIYNSYSGQVFITKDMHFDKAYLYDRKNLKPYQFADDEWG